MTLVPMTTVGAFSAVGSILVVALMIVPAGTAYLIGKIATSVGVGVASAVSGYDLAVHLDVSISGMLTVAAGVLFALASRFSPAHRMVARTLLRGCLRERFAADLLGMHRAHHRTSDEALDSLAGELDWSTTWLSPVVCRTAVDRAVSVDGGIVRLTERGRGQASRIAAALDPAVERAG